MYGLSVLAFIVFSQSLNFSKQLLKLEGRYLYSSLWYSKNAVILVNPYFGEYNIICYIYG